MTTINFYSAKQGQGVLFPFCVIECNVVLPSKLSYFATLLSIALKKPAITQKHDEVPDVVVGAGAGPGVGAADGPGGQGLSLDQPRLQQDRVEGRETLRAPPGVNKQADKPIVFEEDNKAGIKADELGEQQRQLRGTLCSAAHPFNYY